MIATVGTRIRRACRYLHDRWCALYWSEEKRAKFAIGLARGHVTGVGDAATKLEIAVALYDGGDFFGARLAALESLQASDAQEDFRRAIWAGI